MCVCACMIPQETSRSRFKAVLRAAPQPFDSNSNDSNSNDSNSNEALLSTMGKPPLVLVAPGTHHTHTLHTHTGTHAPVHTPLHTHYRFTLSVSSSYMALCLPTFSHFLIVNKTSLRRESFLFCFLVSVF
jgi:hypothetical protein